MSSRTLDARSLADRLTRAVHRALRAGRDAELTALAGRGAGDWTYGIDELAERELDAWFTEQAAEGPLSLLTEDRGWRHRGPEGELPGFGHGGPRVAVDPIDGTRPLMWDLRSAWTVVSVAGPGAGQPRLTDLVEGVVAEIPDTRAALGRVLHARLGEGCRAALLPAADGTAGPDRVLRAQEDDAELVHGFYPFFGYGWELRPMLGAISAAFFERLREHEGFQPDGAFDDGYLSSGGQLALLALGRYRMVTELRSKLAAERGRATPTAKPYDVAGAILCAREAGCAVTALDGGELDFPLDVETPVDYVAFASPALARRLTPHLLEAIAAR